MIERVEGRVSGGDGFCHRGRDRGNQLQLLLPGVLWVVPALQFEYLEEPVVVAEGLVAGAITLVLLPELA